MRTRLLETSSLLFSVSLLASRGSAYVSEPRCLYDEFKIAL